jgi:uncharacterized protein (DUF1778 family)
MFERQDPDIELIYLSAASYEAFLEAISQPAKPVPEMVELFKRKPPWEEAERGKP